MPNFGAPELIILLVVILVVFGAKRLPDSARSLGRSMRIFKAETRGLREDGSTDVTGRDTTVHAEPLPPVQPVQPSPPPAGYGTPPPPAPGYATPPAGDQAQQPRP